MPGLVTLLESNFPFSDVSRVVAADRRAVDPAYQAHRWWARRPPALLRSVLLAASLPGDVSPSAFWEKYGSDGHPLEGMTILDPFAGGGTTLVEAARLGGLARGSDVDPMAARINSHQLDTPAEAEVLEAGERLLDHLSAEIGHLWSSSDDSWELLHEFTLARISCLHCASEDHLYRSLVLARSVGKPGSVQRDAATVAFCPTCLSLHDLVEGATELQCCGTTVSLSSSTFVRGRFQCGQCGVRSSHEDLQTGTAPRVLLAIEEVASQRTGKVRRRIRQPGPADLQRHGTLPIGAKGFPEVALLAGDGDNRPLSFGITTVQDLHTPRQLAYLTEAFRWIDDARLEPRVSRALSLAVSTTITCNNRLCGYATDYGRLAPLFSVRAFSMPSLAVELNPLSRRGGRGTLSAALIRVGRSCREEVRRHVISGAEVEPRVMSLPRQRVPDAFTRSDATEASVPEVLADLCITDPPYFDFIPYDTLSQVFRAWLPENALGGAPLLPATVDPVNSFGQGLGAALSNAASGCKPDGLLAFTYKGSADAWAAVGIALDEAKLRVTGLWPVLADPHMGHHANAGNCEFDMVVVARSVSSTEPIAPASGRVESLIVALREHRPVSQSDVANILGGLLHE